ncbi:hypothetical protein AUEXF2481DRAFT_69593 [Aureobasidium subglaciale EXF-2481]|uniref:Leucine-rich repeat-containing protein n=1 Tax=Aureobasidium subglaciale (strain EXF-2481) TaxID=1043005 RepID=A0A074YXV6_AURSE|nr:uncharacterized protein AUEXF2481DRAFT_69593 [Aureobasidium subglaciale EXF-2481]KAI5194858.1 hypothetical protein E4T38_09367 [Aureobasidium subglaciale]KAI5213976.1 hypothetical protein E4T40_09318 [Aureobasidium subglaciale]KAI5216349.1 hypothetical protein E4T41_09319 [Aureobasidium subglaciale]KAI5254180.1 hypothetical protein E4T46_09274 [Aureobasidium subglaciale]KEQ91676.1 hypothetical protein AUEXF2481DRAFT_69593 [Aureobasidium subglaciale EXF-2481]
MDTEDGHQFIKQLAYFVRTHEKALANALQLQRRGSQNVTSPIASTAMSPPAAPSASSSTSSASTFAAALSLPYLSFTSQTVKPVKLTLTPHHLFYLLSRFDELGINVGPMTIRLENIHNDVAPGNYVSFLSAPKSRGRSDADSVRSSSSVRSVMSTMSSMWSHFNLSGQSNKEEKQKAAEMEDLKYLYSAFTKIPCLRLSPDHRSKLIAGYEEFPFDTAVPLFAFKNVSALEICDVDFRQLFGWDRMAEQLRSLTVKRASIDDLADLTINIVLDDMDKRRRRSSKAPIPSSPAVAWPAPSPSVRTAAELASASVPNSPMANARRSSIGSPQLSTVNMTRTASSDGKKTPRLRQRSISPSRPSSSRHNSSYGHGHQPRSNTPKFRRESGSSGSSIHSSTPRNSTSNLLALGIVPASKWRFLRHLSLSDNSLTFVTAHSLAPLAQTLHSLDLSSNLLTEIPESLASLTNLRALNLSNCMIDSLHSLLRNPLPAITTLNLRSNRLTSLAGIERLFSLERVDLRDNKLTDPTELARLTRMPEMQDIYVAKNPFIRTHSNYRVTIFNLFRATPGYTEDVKIDSTAPSYSERRQLVDRAPEPPSAPTPLPVPEDERSDDALNMPDLGERSRQAAAEHTQGSTRSISDYSTASQRRKKGTRRRIVELSHEMGSEQSTQNDGPPSPRTAVKATVSAEEQRFVRATSSPPRLPPLDTGASSMSIEGLAVPTEDDEEIGVNSEVYRQKIETLKTDLGNGWLTALGEEMRNGTEREYSGRPSIGGQRTDSREVTVGGRRLG